MTAGEIAPRTDSHLDDWGGAATRSQIADHLRQRIRSAHTTRAYESDFRLFVQWCEEHGRESLPASERTVVEYLLHTGDPESGRDHAPLKWSTLARRVAGIHDAHRRACVPWRGGDSAGEDLIAATLTYIAVQQKSPTNSPTALSLRQLYSAVETLPRTDIGLRNAAMLQLGFFGALRSSEIVSLQLDDITFSEGSLPDREEGITVLIRASKTDRTGRGESVSINYSANRSRCPVRALQRWIGVRGSSPGPLFMKTRRLGVDEQPGLTTQTMSRILKGALAATGTDPARFSAHSLRSGFATTAGRVDVPARLIKQQTRHASYEMVDRYIQTGSSLSQNATRYML